jgi:hypothetical protein
MNPIAPSCMRLHKLRWTSLSYIALKHYLVLHDLVKIMGDCWDASTGIESFGAELPTKQLDYLLLLAALMAAAEV